MNQGIEITQPPPIPTTPIINTSHAFSVPSVVNTVPINQRITPIDNHKYK